MSERKISYLNRTFEEYRSDLRRMIRDNYPDIANDFDDASIGSWLIDLGAAIADNLSYHIDGVYTETNIDTAQQANSLFSIARSNGLKVPGPKGAIVEITFKVRIPATSDGKPNYQLTPIIKKGTRLLASTGEYFETIEDVDFEEQFNSEATSDRNITPLVNSNNGIEFYELSKRVIAIAGQSMIYKEVIDGTSNVPFAEITIPRTNVLSVESVIFKTGNYFSDEPSMNEFMMPMEKITYNDKVDNNKKYTVYRFFEVDNLLEQYRWGDDVRDIDYPNGERPKKLTYAYYNDGQYSPVTTITKGMWMPLTQKFITEYDENGYMRITFGSGERTGNSVDPINNNSEFSKHQISKYIKNGALGKTPINNSTLYILYRIGGGYGSNLAANTINTITYLNCDSKYCLENDESRKAFELVKMTISATNEDISICGKDMPTVDELRYMIKYNNSSMNRCVTVKDYEDRIMKMPSRYGYPFKVSATEENNKIMVYLLNIDNNGHLTDVIPKLYTDNITSYLSMYRSINDFVEIKPGRVINLSFDVDIFIDKNYTKDVVVRDVIECIRDYMDVNDKRLGGDIFVGDIMKEIGKIDGVLNLIDISITNEYDGMYSKTVTSQPTFEGEDGKPRIDLDECEYILCSDADEMFEIKYPERDIRVRFKMR